MKAPLPFHEVPVGAWFVFTLQLNRLLYAECTTRSQIMLIAQKISDEGFRYLSEPRDVHAINVAALGADTEALIVEKPRALQDL